MALVESLLTAIMRADGDALVMHVGEKPYVVTAAGPIELSSQGLNLQAMEGMIAQVLTPDAANTLAEFGAVEHELAGEPSTQDRFTAVVARGGEDVWIEIRRHRRAPVVETDAKPQDAVAAEGETAAEQRVGAESQAAPEHHSGDIVSPMAAAPDADAAAIAGERPQPHSSADTHVHGEPDDAAHEDTFHSEVNAADAAPAAAADSPAANTAAAPAPEDDAPRQSTVVEMRPAMQDSPAPGVAAVIPMRTVRIEVPAGASPRAASAFEIEHLLTAAASRGATALHLMTQTPPFLRVDDDVRMVEGERALTAGDVEAALSAVVPEPTREALRRGESVEWTFELHGVGRVRASTFTDYRGPGAIFKFMSLRPASADHLGLSTGIQSLATETEGLVVVASPSGQGRTTVLGALVDMVNRRRTGYVITLEREVKVVHDHHQALISQRELGASPDQGVAAARAALRETPDVLVIDDLLSPAMVRVALEAAGAGALVFVTVSAGSTTAALSKVLDQFDADRTAVQALLAEHLRGVVAQVLLRRTTGGRAAARELLLNTATVAALVADGRLSELPEAIDEGHRHGLSSMNDALVDLVRRGVVDVREVCRRTDDRDGLLLALRRERFDTSLVERLA